MVDFKPHLENLPKLLNNYSIIAWDAPGLGLKIQNSLKFQFSTILLTGKSFPPYRNVIVEELEVNAEILNDFLEHLKIRKCSLLGYSAGGITSFFFAAKHPEKVEKMILTSTNPFVSQHQVTFFQAIRDISNWDKQTRESLIAQYGVEYLTSMWEKYVDIVDDIAKKYTQEFMKPIFNKIEAETLIVYGEKDPFTPKDFMNFMAENIKRSKLVVYPGGRHNLHNHKVDDFNKKVAEFMLTRSKI